MLAERKREYDRYLNSDKWKEKRNVVRARDKQRCVDCAATTNLEVHHLTYERFGDEWLSDLVTLCKSCHGKRHKWRRCKTKPSRTKAKVAKPGRKKKAVVQYQQNVQRSRERAKARKKTLALVEANEQLHQTLAANRERRARQAERRTALATWQR